MRILSFLRAKRGHCGQHKGLQLPWNSRCNSKKTTYKSDLLQCISHCFSIRIIFSGHSWAKHLTFWAFPDVRCPSSATRSYFLCWTLDYFALIFWEYQRRLLLRTLVFQLEDTVRLFGTLFLLDPIHFPKSEPCLIIGSVCLIGALLGTSLYT